MPFSQMGGPSYKGFIGVTKKSLVAGEGKLGYSFFREHENFFLKGRNDIVV